MAVSASIINVPDDYLHIQEAIDYSVDGDTVLLQPGTYIENLNFNGHNIILGSLFLITGDTSYIYSTIIDGDQSGPVVSFENGEDSGAVITGLTVQHGHSRNGGGIYCENSSPIINNNIISNNSASGELYNIGCGGGIYCINSDPVIINNTIYRNAANHEGGGIYCNNSNPVIINNIISENRVFSANGGGICCCTSNPIIRNNTIIRNSTGFDGTGGGIYCHDSVPVIKNTIFWNNTLPEIYSDNSSQPAITYCSIANQYEGEGNINVNPQFINPNYGNYNVCLQSPCIDAGDVDLYDPDGTRSDIGVFYPEHPECYVGNIWYVSVAGDDSTGDGSPGNPFGTIQFALDVSLHGDTVIVENGIYQEQINFNGKSVVLASNNIFTRDTLDIHNTIIDGDSDSPTVSFVSGEDSQAIITGFTINNGAGPGIGCYLSRPKIINNIISESSSHGIYCSHSNAEIVNNIIRENISVNFGGGIYCLHSSPAINNNIIYGNSAHSGGGVYCYKSKPIINGNTICNNTAVGYAAVGGGVYVSLNSFPIIVNSIIWGNTASDMGDEIFVYGGSPEISYCDIEGGWNGEGNINDDPLFCGPDNYWLSDISPCVGAGENGVDIGVLGVGCEASDIYDEIQTLPAEYALFQNYPNPFNQSTTITFSIPEPNIVTIEIYDLLGRKVESPVKEFRQAGVHRVKLNTEQLSSGVYFYRLQAGDYSKSKRMILLK